MSDPIPDKPTEEQEIQALAELKAVLTRPIPAIPQAELDLLAKIARGDTGQSRTSRYLLFLLVGAKDPTGFEGEGLLEMRTLDRNLADTFLKIADWWRGPTKSDQPLYAILADLEKRFANQEAEASYPDQPSHPSHIAKALNG